MQIEAILSMMISERDKIDRALAALQGTAKRQPTPKRSWTAAQRRTQSRRMRAYWAARRRAA